MPSVLDSSAVLAVLFDESGADVVVDALPDSVMGSVNACEVLRVLIRRGSTPDQARSAFEQLRIPVLPFSSEDAQEAAALAATIRLGIGDSACLALARRLDSGAVLTGDKVWGTLKLGVKVTQIR